MASYGKCQHCHNPVELDQDNLLRCSICGKLAEDRPIITEAEYLLGEMADHYFTKSLNLHIAKAARHWDILHRVKDDD